MDGSFRVWTVARGTADYQRKVDIRTRVLIAEISSVALSRSILAC